MAAKKSVGLVADSFNVKIEDVLSRKRSFNLLEARLATNIVLKDFKLRVGEIALVLNKDHSVIVYYEKKIKDLPLDSIVRTIAMEVCGLIRSGSDISSPLIELWDEGDEPTDVSTIIEGRIMRDLPLRDHNPEALAAYVSSNVYGKQSNSDLVFQGYCQVWSDTNVRDEVIRLLTTSGETTGAAIILNHATRRSQ